VPQLGLALLALPGLERLDPAQLGLVLGWEYGGRLRERRRRALALAHDLLD
jgi:hypothetical protein